MLQGWISVHRKILDNPIVCKDADYFSVWMYLLLNATHQNTSVVFKGKKIILERGQLITGRKIISDKLKISESKVQRILKTFENEQQIEQQTSNQNRLISIINWNIYQNNEQQTEQPMNNERTANKRPVNTNNNDKNEKNERIYIFSNEKIGTENEPNDIFATIRELYNSVCGSYPRLVKMSEARKKAINARLKNGYTLEDFRVLFEKAESSSFLKGGNKRDWSATFDWLITDGNMAKVLDGNYDDKQKQEVNNESGYGVKLW